MSASAKTFGELLREWRARRRLSQLELALDAGISPKHVSFIETGRARPSREMVLHVAELLAVPLRERNLLLTAAGFAAVFPQHRLDEAALEAARRTVDTILRGHEPNPALAMDRHSNLVAANRAAERFLGNVSPSLLQPPVNVLRVSLHPDGLAPRTVNLSEWRAHLLGRLRRQIELTADRELIALEKELLSYPAPPKSDERDVDTSAIAIPFRVRTELGELSFISTTTVFGTPLEITLAELAIESFFPANEETARALDRLRDS